MQFENWHHSTMEPPRKATWLRNLRSWVRDTLVDVNTRGEGASEPVPTNAARTVPIVDILIGTACPYCGLYFRKDKKELAAQHLVDHDSNRFGRTGVLAFHRSTAALVFACGVASLSVSIARM